MQRATRPNHQLLPEWTALFREYLDPVVCQVLVVEQDEEHIQKSDERGNHADDDTIGLSEEIEEAWHHSLQSFGEVLAFEERLYVSMVLVDPF